MDKIINLIQKGELNLAWQQVQVYIKNNPNDPQGIILASKIQLSAGLIDKAIFTIEHAINKDESYKNVKADLMAFLAHLYSSNLNFERTLQIANRLRPEKLKLADSYNYLANALARCEKHQQSLTLYEQGLASFSDDLQLLEGATNLKVIAGDFIKAEQYLNRALSIQPDNGRYIWLYSDIAKTFDNDKVKELYTKFSKYLNEFNASISHSVYWHYGLGNFALNLNMYKESAEHYLLGAKIRRSEFKNYSIDDEITWLEQVNQFQSQLPLLTDDLEHNSPIPIFIVGMPRSGTTLLATLLSKYENIKDVGELPIMHNLAQQLSSNSISLKQVRNIYLTEIKKRAKHHQYVIDQLPTNFININLIKAALPEAKIILLKRDVNDIFISNLFFLFAPDSMHFTYNETELLKFINQFKHMTKDVNTILHYEDLVQETETTIQHFIIEEKIRTGKRVEESSYIATGSSVEVRQKIYTTSVEKWKEFEPYLSGIVPI